MKPEPSPAGVGSWRVLPRTRADTPLYLSRGGGLTTFRARALRDGFAIEPEAVNRATLERLAERAASNRAAARALTRTDLAAASVSVRLARCQAQARATKVDAHTQLRLVRLAIENRRSASHIAGRLAALERRLWPDLPA
jgi:hypothetical protein